MPSITVDKYMRLLEPLSSEDKLELLSRLSEHLKNTLFKPKTDKEKLLDKLAGSWSDIDASIINSNTSKPVRPENAWKQLSGAWKDDNESAEDLIHFLRTSRISNRTIEPLD